MNVNHGKRICFQHADAAGNTNGWQIVYTGFILIMLSFFILLTSFSSLDPSKITRFVGSFSNAVSVLNQGKSIEPGPIVLDAELNLLAGENRIAELFENVRQVSREEGLDQIQLLRTKHGVVMTLKDTLLFDSAEANLSYDAFPRLEKIGRLIQRIDVPVEIEGHTDNRPINTDRFPSNWELSTARAVSVLRYFIETLNIEARRLSAVGYGEFHPIVADDSPEHRAMNRRVNFVFKIDQ
jgi:chemotaxis protein MotB